MKKVYKDSVLSEQVVSAVLPNGLKILIAEKKDFKTNFAIFGTKYGSIDTAFSVNDGETIAVPEGIAHYLEHKLFESEDGDAFARFSETGASANAFTSFDRTCYLFSCADRFEENLDILLDFVQSPYFTPKTVQKEQGIIGQEIRMYDDSPEWCVLFNMLEAMYEQHPVRIDIAGTVESISHITAELLYDCYNAFYNPANMFVCIAGNVDAEKTIARIEKAIKPVPPVKLTRAAFSEKNSVKEQYVEKKMEIAKPIFNFGFKEECVGERTPKECICSGLMLDILAGDTSPLYEKLTEAGLINDEFHSEYFQGNDYAAAIFQGESSDPKAVSEAICTEIERLKKEGISDNLFESARRSLYGMAIKSYNNVESIAMNLVDCAMLDVGPFDDIDIMRSITKADVEKRLELLNPECSVLSVILPKR
ncbi:MAG: insulinase family protein [Ruminococcaceae bacterium]|nr:insulinase family protein [Oscillospiraceae bacterium]